MYKKNPLKIVDEKKSQQSKFLLNIVDLQKLIEKKPTKILIYATIIVKQQKGNSNNSNHPMETNIRKHIWIFMCLGGIRRAMNKTSGKEKSRVDESQDWWVEVQDMVGMVVEGREFLHNCRRPNLGDMTQ